MVNILHNPAQVCTSVCMYVNGITRQSFNKRDDLQVAKMARYAVMTNTFCLCGTAIRTIIEVATLQCTVVVGTACIMQIVNLPVVL